jgi:energy-coupling factor transporter ATP-binding protein EcfA2
MIIHRLRATRFGCLDNCTVSFMSGLNVVFGPNESGKSTLQRALLMALLDRPGKRKANEDARQWGADRLFQLELEFETEGGRRWVLAKDYEQNKVHLEGGSGATTSWEEILSVLSHALGTSSSKMLQSTCCVAQDELTAVSEGRKEISRALETMVTGGEDDTCTADAIAALQRAILGLRRGLGARGAANLGRLATITERKRALEGLAASHGASLEQDELARERLTEARERLAQLENELQPRQAARQAADEAITMAEQLCEWRQKEATVSSSLERIADAEGKIAAAASGLTDLGMPPLSEVGYQELTRLHERVTVLRSQALTRAQSSAQTGLLPVRPSALPGRTASPLAPAMLMLVATCLGIASILGSLGLGDSAAVLVISIAFSVVADALGIIWLAIIYRYRLEARGQPGLSCAPNLRHSQLENDALLERESQDLSQRLAALGCSEWEMLETRQLKSRTLRAQRDDARALLEGLLPTGRSKSDLEVERRAASLTRRDLEEALNTPAHQRSLQLGVVEYQALCKQIDRLTAERQSLTREAIGLQARLDAARITHEDLMAVEEQLSAATSELIHIEETLATYHLVVETMQTARERTLVTAQDQLAPLASFYLAELTGGRYTSTTIDADLNVLVACPENPDGAVEPGYLSKGAQDQLYLALRLALMDLLFPSARPPLFLDDPFVKFDANRRRAALQLCQRIAQHRQVILFTCSDDYGQWGHTISMPIGIKLRLLVAGVDSC